MTLPAFMSNQRDTIKYKRNGPQGKTLGANLADFRFWPKVSICRGSEKNYFLEVERKREIGMRNAISASQGV